MKKATLVYHVYSGEISYVIIGNNGEKIKDGSFERCVGLFGEGDDVDGFFITMGEVGDYLFEAEWEKLLGYPIEIIGAYCI